MSASRSDLLRSVALTVALLSASASPLAHAGLLDPSTPIDRRVATMMAIDYEVYELVPGCTDYEIGDIVTLYIEGTPPQTTTIGGSGLAAGTKVYLIPQRPSR